MQKPMGQVAWVMRRASGFAGGLALLLAAAAPGAVDASEPFDLVVAGGRVVDPASGTDAVRNIGIRGGVIVTVTREPLTGRRTIDATGKVVAPGFVDVHSHAVDTKTGSRMQVQDGVTTQLELESGMLPVAAWYDRVAAEGRPAHYGTSVAWSFARAAAVAGLTPRPSLAFFHDAQASPAWMTDPATPEQLVRIRALIDEGLRAGALGVGVNAGYAPGYTAEEIFAVHEVAARHRGRPVVYHVRHMGTGPRGGVLDSLYEVVALALVTGTPVHVCHLHSAAMQEVERALAVVRAARARGLTITTEAYPYGTASTIIGAPFLRDPAFPAALGFGPEDIVYLATGERPASMERLRALQAADPGGLALMHFLDLDEAADAAKFRAVMVDGNVVIASDAMPWQDGARYLADEWPLPATARSHPRSAGTFARFLREWVREREEVSLVEAIRRITLLPAQILEVGVPAMRRKGRIGPDADADLVIFDLDTITDRATFERPAQPSAGIAWVVVSGQAVVADGVFDPGIDAGRPIRVEPEPTVPE